jgi:hypothetical protein
VNLAKNLVGGRHRHVGGLDLELIGTGKDESFHRLIGHLLSFISRRDLKF